MAQKSFKRQILDLKADYHKSINFGNNLAKQKVQIKTGLRYLWFCLNSISSELYLSPLHQLRLGILHHSS